MLEEFNYFFEKLNIEKLKDQSFIENELILTMGLNNEMLHEQPNELKKYF